MRRLSEREQETRDRTSYVHFRLSWRRKYFGPFRDSYNKADGLTGNYRNVFISRLTENSGDVATSSLCVNQQDLDVEFCFPRVGTVTTNWNGDPTLYWSRRKFRRWRSACEEEPRLHYTTLSSRGPPSPNVSLTPQRGRGDPGRIESVNGDERHRNRAELRDSEEGAALEVRALLDVAHTAPGGKGLVTSAVPSNPALLAQGSTESKREARGWSRQKSWKLGLTFEETPLGEEVEAQAASPRQARFIPPRGSMDAVAQRTELLLRQDSGVLGATDASRWTLLEVQLVGGAPWGFTLRGGREHKEPLLITKVEEGSKAATVQLQVGDELVTINEVPLSGYRQEAICLVKGSYKTLSLVVRRRNEPVGRPHSWHSTKFTEDQSEVAKGQATPPAVWHTRYDTSSQDLTKGWDQTNLRCVSDHFSSLGSMDSLEQSTHPYPLGRLSPAKSSNSVDRLGVSGGGSSKRDSAYSSFSASSGTPDYTLSRSNAASMENMVQRVGRQDERPGHLAITLSLEGQESPRAEETPGSRTSTSGRSTFGPVWHVPEKKRTMPPSPSPPPPPPPVRSDSFAVTKVHEKGLTLPYSEGPVSHPQQKPQARGTERGSCEALDNIRRGPEARRSYNPPHKVDTLHPKSAADGYSNNHQLSSNRLYSLSSTDVRLGQPPYGCVPYHQRQYSDEGTFFQQPRVGSGPKQQNASGCYSSMQELPTNSQQPYSQTQVRTSSSSLSSTAIDQIPDASSQSRYYCVTARQPGQTVSQASLVRVEGWKATVATETAQIAGDRSSVSSQKAFKAKQTLPEQHPDSHDSDGYHRLQDRPASDSLAQDIPLTSRPNMEDKVCQRKNNGYPTEVQHLSYPPSKNTEQKKAVQLEAWFLPEDRKFCPQRTPMLHSLSQESMSMAEKPMEGSSATGQQEAIDPATGKAVRRSDRYATTLRNEIQMKRAQLQKSKSAATLTSQGEVEEDPEVWKSESTEPATSLSDNSFSSTYKDHLKEAQERVLRATSFRRRDLEPVLPEHPAAEALPGYTSTGLPQKDLNPLPGLPEVLHSKPSSSQVLRIGGRKRFTAEKKVRSFSEPEKMNEVGVQEDLPSAEKGSSFADRCKFFETTTIPALSKTAPNQVQPSSVDDFSEGQQAAQPWPRDYKESHQETWMGRHQERPCNILLDADKQVALEQQRLGTFAEYEATWNVQRKPPEARASGRYHSADNILDPGMEECSKASYIHERSRSSPSADFCGQNLQSLERKSTESSQPERQHSGQDCTAARLFDWEPREHRVTEKFNSTECLLDPAPKPAPKPTQWSDTEDVDPRPHHKRPPQRPPPPKLDRHRQLETASSSSDSQESLTGHQGNRVTKSLSPVSDLHPGFTLSAGLATSSGKDPTRTPRPKDEQGPARKTTPSHSETPPPAPSSSSASSTNTALLRPLMEEGPRSLSPQFAPQRLTDQPPVSLPDEASIRMETAEQSAATVKKVPIKIVHLESSWEKESRQYLVPNEAASSPSGPSSPPLASLGPSEPSYSLFCAYTRQREPEGEQASTSREVPPTQEALLPQETSNGSNSIPATTNHTKEDRKWEELTRDIVGRDKSLADILDQSKMKTTMDLMEGIFPQGEQVLEGVQQRRKVVPKQAPRRSTEERRDEDNLAAAVTMVTSSSYYSTSAPKAELLIKMKDMQEQIEEQDSEDELDVDLANKKHELIDSLSRKLQVLREARESLQEDMEANNALGEEVELTVQQVCKPNEVDKFRMFVGDLDKVVSLLLSLSGRLARVENALNNLEEDASAEEKRTLLEKRKLLIRQHNDAKELKENLDRRERVVYEILAGYLSEDSLADYEHFVKMKSALIIEQRKLEDKIKLGEEQLKCLTDSLPLDQRRPF
ncbi:protein Shroom2 [Arapaima gigas]